MPLTKKTKRRASTGAAKNYVTRSRAVRKLQISLQDFRRLCIFKGIYPREPRNKNKVRKGATPSTTFYYTRDIQYLFHEPLLQKFREHKALAKKIGRALGRNEVGNAVRLEKNAPRMTLDHLVKERYPTFVDALRDLDDALTMLFLFANLPSTQNLPPKTIAKCQRLCLEFQHYLITSRSLRKSFLSIKGIYYQATIQGQDILWLVPYKFVQKTAGDIDFRIMATFVEFYTTLLGFVNYRLYTTLGLVYPPKFDVSSDEKGGELGAYTLHGPAVEFEPNREVETNGTNGHIAHAEASEAAQAEADKVALLQFDESQGEMQDGQQEQVEATNDSLDTFQPITQNADTLLQPTFTGSDTANLFSDFTFFLSRETPKAALEFITKSFGCTRVGWDEILGDGAWTNDENDTRITHQVVDRPAVIIPDAHTDASADEEEKPTAPVRIPGRIYVQPQWIWDSINQGKLLRPDLYAPGATLPPHLSPWVKPKSGMYDPTVPLEEQEEEDEAEIFEERMREEEQEAVTAAENGDEVESDENGDESSEKSEDEEQISEDEEEIGEDEVQAGEGMQVDVDSDSEQESVANVAQDEWDGLSDENGQESSEEDEEATRYQRELDAEAAGLPVPVQPVQKTNEARKRKERKAKAEQEELDRQRMMMSNKKRKMFDSMQRRAKKTDVEAEKLRMKRRRIEKAKNVAR